MNNDQSSDHLVLGGLLFLVFSLVVALVFVYTRAGDTESGTAPTTTAEITNEAPTVDSVLITYLDTDISSLSQVDLELDGANTNGDLKDIEVVLRRSGASAGNSCTTNLNDCYRGSFVSIPANPTACTFTNIDATSSHYSCAFNLEYFTDGTLADGGQFAAENWVAEVKVTDLSDDVGTLSETTEVAGLLGLDIPLEIGYGSFTLGATTTPAETYAAGTNVIHTLQQKGNVIADVVVQGSGTGPSADGVMACSALGSIPVVNQKWATSSVAYSDAISLSATGVDTDIAVQYQQDDDFVSNPSVKKLYWHIGIPTTGVRGTCTGQNTISIVAGS